MDQTVDLNLVKRAWDRIEKELSPYVDNWYRIEIGGNSYISEFFNFLYPKVLNI